MRITSIDIETTGLSYDEHQVLEIGACIFDTNTDKFEPIATYRKFINNPYVHGDYFAVQMNVEILRSIIGLQNLRKQYQKEYEKLVKLELFNYSDCSEIEKNAHLSIIKNQQIVVNKLEFESSFIVDPANITDDFKEWLVANNAYYADEKDKKHMNITGKNYWGFDNRFLEHLIGWCEKIHPHRRSFDPANLYYEQTDNVLPSLEECKKRALTQSQKYLSLNSYESLFKDTNVTHDALDDSIDVAKLVFFAIKRDEFINRILSDNVLTLIKNEKE